MGFGWVGVWGGLQIYATLPGLPARDLGLDSKSALPPGLRV